MVGEIVDEITRELFVSEAVAYLQEDAADQSEQEAVRMAVLRRIEFLDANFLTALGGFIAVSESRGDAQLATLLRSVRREVLKQVAGRLPSAAQALDAALRHADKDKRLEVLRAVLAGGSGDVPGCDIDTLSATASDFIDQMEERKEVPDRGLLARLVILREELRVLRLEAAFTDPAASAASAEPVRSNVPQRCAAFLKELVAVGDPLRRMALLARTFESDWEGAAPKQKPMAGGAASGAEAYDAVRPGRLLATLQSTVRQLELDAVRHAAVLGRLEQIRGEALVVLDRMHGGGGEGAGAAEEQGGGAAAAEAPQGPQRSDGVADSLEGGEADGRTGGEAGTGEQAGSGASRSGRSGAEGVAELAARAGIRPGDVVESWEAEMGPDGRVRLVGEGAGKGGFEGADDGGISVRVVGEGEGAASS